MSAITLAVIAGRGLVRALRHLGGPGLIALGVVSAVVPLPGSVDAVTIILAARHPELWLYYASMACFGAVLGSYLVYRVGARGGKRLLVPRMSTQFAHRWSNLFSRHALLALSFAALAPPPLPVAPLLLIAGASKYSLARFLGWTTIWRGMRYIVIAWLAATYGRRGMARLAQYQRPFLIVLVCLFAAAALWVWRAPGEADSREDKVNTAI